MGAATGMPLGRHDIIVIGASAGGVEALQRLVQDLPPDIAAAVFIVLHIPPWCPSELPFVLARCTPLLVSHPRNGEPIMPGHIYVAPPDQHMVVEEQQIVLWKGPKENLQRPAINTLFRSAAVAHGERVVGVVLTGALDDGATGLWWIKRYGGMAVVQDPDEAKSPEMPWNALQHAEVDYIAGLAEMGRLLGALADGVKVDRRTPPRFGQEKHSAWN